jgi:Tfp pilus assembly pilus retraction ATPase PilT
MDLGHYLRAILSQRLVRSRGGKLVAAVELMLNTPHIKDLVTNRPDIPVTLVTDATRPIHAEQAPALLADWGRRGVTLAASDEILAG